MVNVDKAVVARLERNGKNFEILVDCDKALDLRNGKSVSIEDVLAVDEIYKDVKKGDKASEHDLQRIFKTTDFIEVSKIIITNGSVQLTREHLAKQREEIRKQVINIIHRNAVDPKTGLPHPPQRIESAMEEAKVHIDENKSAGDQVDDILKKLKIIIPIRFETKKIQVVIPAKFAGQSYHILKSYGNPKTEWLGDGSLKANLELPGGLVDEFFSKLNGLCHGEVESKILE
ncbi:ribosome assembly factor SBDS [Candidatus Woesearchaeota archaeon]|nr:ribosome assembly factor SBDS [Candidatus Woesearchaeota archaeon]